MDPLTVIGVLAGVVAAIAAVVAVKKATRQERQQQDIAERQAIFDRHSAIAPDITKHLNELDDLLAAVMRAERPDWDETLKEQVGKNIQALRPYEVCRRLVEAEEDYFSRAIDYSSSGIEIRRADPPNKSSRAIIMTRSKVYSEIQKVRHEIIAWFV